MRLCGQCLGVCVRRHLIFGNKVALKTVTLVIVMIIITKSFFLPLQSSFKVSVAGQWECSVQVRPQVHSKSWLCHLLVSVPQTSMYT